MSKKTKQSEFNKVLTAKDMLVIAFGAMIGWGWVVSSGDWIQRGGVVGAALGFALGGVMIYFVGMTYSELTAALPQCGGEHVFSHKAFGPTGSFVCTWGIIFGYAGVVCFEACALPTIIGYLFPGFLKGYLYTVAGFDIYLSWLIVAMAAAVFMTWINIIGVKTAANMQTLFTVVIIAVGLAIIGVSAVRGDTANILPQMWVSDDQGGVFKHVIRVAVTTPFFFIGFDVIPQAAEEIKGSLKKIGMYLIISVVMAVLFYGLVILAVGYMLNPQEIQEGMQGNGLVTANVLVKAFSSKAVGNVVIIGGLCGIVSSWNSFMIGGSRAMYSMADSNMIPKAFAYLHPKYKTPVNSLVLIGLFSMLSPLAGRQMLVWISDAGNLGCCVAYCMVSLSFIILRKKEPNMPRPLVVKNHKFIGWMAVILSGGMVLCYIIPGSGSTLAPQEWAMAGGWSLLGLIFYLKEKKRYGAEFGKHVDIEIEYSEEDLKSIKENQKIVDRENGIK